MLEPNISNNVYMRNPYQFKSFYYNKATTAYPTELCTQLKITLDVKD